jgi:hypothetical protein
VDDRKRKGELERELLPCLFARNYHKKSATMNLTELRLALASVTNGDADYTENRPSMSSMAKTNLLCLDLAGNAHFPPVGTKLLEGLGEF